MSNEDLILEIIEKVHEQGQITAKKVDELRIEQAKQSEIQKNNLNVLQEHIRRTEINEIQIEYVKKHVEFVNTCIKVIAWIGGAVITITQAPVLLSLIRGLLHH